jgi:hypothetical protein
VLLVDDVALAGLASFNVRRNRFFIVVGTVGIDEANGGTAQAGRQRNGRRRGANHSIVENTHTKNGAHRAAEREQQVTCWWASSNTQQQPQQQQQQQQQHHQVSLNNKFFNTFSQRRCKTSGNGTAPSLPRRRARSLSRLLHAKEADASIPPVGPTATNSAALAAAAMTAFADAATTTTTAATNNNNNNNNTGGGWQQCGWQTIRCCFCAVAWCFRSATVSTWLVSRASGRLMGFFFRRSDGLSSPQEISRYCEHISQLVREAQTRSYAPDGAANTCTHEHPRKKNCCMFFFFFFFFFTFATYNNQKKVVFNSASCLLKAVYSLEPSPSATARTIATGDRPHSRTRARDADREHCRAQRRASLASRH